MRRKGMTKIVKNDEKIIIVFDNKINAKNKDICLCNVYVNDTKLTDDFVFCEYNKNEKFIKNWCKKKAYAHIKSIRLIAHKVVGRTLVN